MPIQSATTPVLKLDDILKDYVMKNMAPNEGEIIDVDPFINFKDMTVTFVVKVAVPLNTESSNVERGPNGEQLVKLD